MTATMQVRAADLKPGMVTVEGNVHNRFEVVDVHRVAFGNVRVTHRRVGTTLCFTAEVSGERPYVVEVQE